MWDDYIRDYLSADLFNRPRSQDEIHDYTKWFWKMFDDNVNNPEFSAIIWILAERGGGKTTLGMAIVNKLLEDPTRPIYLFRAPQMLLNGIQQVVPPEYKNRFSIANQLHEISNNGVLFIDEGLDVVNAKEALTIELRDLAKSMSYSRHKRIFVIICSVTNGILKELRSIADIKIYKGLTAPFVESERKIDSFIKRYATDLPDLEIAQSLFISTYKYFKVGGSKEKKRRKSVEGGLVVKLDMCPWYNDKISKNMSEESFDSDYNKNQRIQGMIKDIINEAIEKFGKDLEKPLSLKRVRGWLQIEYKELYSDIKRYVPDVIDQACFLIYKSNKNEEDSSNEQEQKIESKAKIIVPEIAEISEKPIFIDFLEQFYLENLPEEVQFNQKTSFSRETVIEVLRQWASGVGQRNIDVSSDNRNKKIPLGIIGQIIKVFRDGATVLQDVLRIYRVYEFYTAKLTGAEVVSGPGRVDLFYNIDGVKYPGECKLYDDISVSIAIDKTKKLKPSVEYCLEHKIPYFPLFFRNVKWTDSSGNDCDFLFKIPVEGPDTVNVKKKQEFILNSFNPIKFFVEKIA